MGESDKLVMLADQLRDAADWIDANAHKLPESTYICLSDRSVLNVWADTAEELAELVQWIGRGDKYADDHYTGVKRSFGTIKINVWGARAQVCEAKVVGQRTVLRPDPDAPKVEVVEDVIEWQCAPMLAALDAEAKS